MVIQSPDQQTLPGPVGHTAESDARAPPSRPGAFARVTRVTKRGFATRV